MLLVIVFTDVIPDADVVVVVAIDVASAIVVVADAIVGGVT